MSDTPEQSTHPVQLPDGRTINIALPLAQPDGKVLADDDALWAALFLLTPDDLDAADGYWRKFAPRSFAGLLAHDNGFGFDVTAQLWTKNDKPYDDDDVRAVYLAFLAAATADLDRQATAMASGSTSLAAWEKSQARSLQSLYVASDALGRGGFSGKPQNPVVDAITDAVARLKNFGHQLESGPMTKAAVVSRAGLYAGPAHTVFEGSRRDSHQATGAVWEELNVLDKAEHCHSSATTVGCYECTEAGWQPLGAFPSPGLRTCGPQCRCHLAYRVKSPGKLANAGPKDFKALGLSARAVTLASGRSVVLPFRPSRQVVLSSGRVVGVPLALNNPYHGEDGRFASGPDAAGSGGSSKGKRPRHKLPYEQRRRLTIEKVLADAKLDEPGHSFAEYMPVSEQLANRVKAETGVDISGYRHHIEEDHVRHVRRLHGPAGTADHSVPDSAWSLLPEIVERPDTITTVPGNPKVPGDRGGLNFKKRIGNHWFVATQVRSQRGQLSLKTFKGA